MKSRWSIIWAIVLILAGAFLLAQNFGLLGELSAPIWSVGLAALGLLFLLNFITDKEQWWSLIPGCILLGVSAVIYMSAVLNLPGEWAGSLMVFSVGLPFLLIYAVQASRGHKDYWWALIPGGILTFIAIVIAATSRLPGEVIGTLVMWGVALPFLGVYLTERQKNRWALIPAGILLVIGAIPALVLATQSPNVLGGVFFLGLALVFGLIYVVGRGSGESDWAVYPAAILAIIGIGIVLFGQSWWPLVLVGAGVALLVRALRSR
ncbi:MAG: hypothetical protein JW850_00450 [Thermoflexales bacterium]|nr:hypothetical protein [Thermoflexales bacterium]